MRFYNLSLLALAIPLLAACAPEGSSPPAEPGATPAGVRGGQRIILKLRDPELDPGRPEVLHDLSRRAGLSLVYLRPMSGGAHVLLIGGAPDPDRIATGLRQLREFPAVDYVEPDQVMRHTPQ